MKKNKSHLTIKLVPLLRLKRRLIATVLIIFLASLFFIGYIWKTMRTASYFQIKDIIVREADITGPTYLKGRNIFSVDLRSESRYLLETYPIYRKVKLVRVLPNRIFVDFIKRNPIAFLKLYKYFALDEEGVLFYALSEPQELELPVILGLETKIFGPKPGRRYNIKELALALNIIREVRANKILRNYKIKKIDVTNPAQTSIFILLQRQPLDYSKGQMLISVEDLLEVKIGQDDIKDKVVILTGLITQEKFNLASIKYIDLRFKEPVIKLKDAKPK